MIGRTILHYRGDAGNAANRRCLAVTGLALNKEMRDTPNAGQLGNL